MRERKRPERKIKEARTRLSTNACTRKKQHLLCVLGKTVWKSEKTHNSTDLFLEFFVPDEHFLLLLQEKEREREREKQRKTRARLMRRARKRLTTSLDRFSVNCLAADSGLKFFRSRR